jgi:hypothetical protein
MKSFLFTLSIALLVASFNFTNELTGEKERYAGVEYKSKKYKKPKWHGGHGRTDKCKQRYKPGKMFGNIDAANQNYTALVQEEITALS